MSASSKSAKVASQKQFSPPIAVGRISKYLRSDLKNLGARRYFETLRVKTSNGFTMIEVMAAMLILSLVCIAYSQNQVAAIQLVKATRYRNTALMLATQKMAEIDYIVQSKGIEFLKDEEKGEFDQEKYETYGWETTKKNIPVPDFSSLISQASGATAGEGDEEEQPQKQQGSFEGPMKAVTELWGKSIIEFHLVITWKEGEQSKSYTLMTHYMASNAIQQIQGLVGSMTGGGAAGQSSSGSGGSNGQTPTGGSGSQPPSNGNGQISGGSRIP